MSHTHINSMVRHAREQAGEIMGAITYWPDARHNHDMR
jgi:hypothetical protein